MAHHGYGACYDSAVPSTIERVKARPDAEFLTLRKAAEWYDIGMSTLRQMADRGLLTKNWRRGDKRLWLKVDELERELRPRPVDPPDA